MSVYSPLYQQLSELGYQEWVERLAPLVEQRLSINNHGDMPKWSAALNSMPDVTPSTIELTKQVAIGLAADLIQHNTQDVTETLMQLHPWRKGPYSLFGIDIETEWHSDWKWDRLIHAISPLEGRKVLDVGGGNGYHGWRMLGAGAELVVGIDPTLLFVMQYQVMKQYLADKNHYVLPLGIEDLPKDLALFDSVFSMGVLYHRRSPIDHLYDLRATLRSGGELILETLIIEGELGEVLMPENRYAKMRNVWFLPSVPTMKLWLQRSGFRNVRCVDISKTTIEEQRTTSWMRFESLVDYLDPNDHSKTIEGLPAPLRAVFIAEAP